MAYLTPFCQKFQGVMTYMFMGLAILAQLYQIKLEISTTIII